MEAVFLLLHFTSSLNSPNMKEKHALILGASGLIGSHVLNQLSSNPDYAKITLLVRKKLQIDNPKIEQREVNFDDSAGWAAAFDGVDVVFCAIGTTRSKTPDLVQYRKVDYDIPVHAIRHAALYRVPKFMLVSSVGADDQSKNFYLKIKGEVETILNQANIDVCGIFQPSLLLGERKEKRFGEGIARAIMPLFNFLVPSKYKAIQSATVAHAMIHAASKQHIKSKVYLYQDIVNQD